MRKKIKNDKELKDVRYTILLYILIFISCFGCSCSSDDDENSKIDHVLLVYLGGDNNLSDETDLKLEAISRGWQSDSKSRILVYQDAKDMSARLLEITGNGSFVTIGQYGKENSANKDVFHRVITDAKTLYPHAHFNLLVFSHASGWLPSGSLQSPKSLIQVKSIFVDGENQMELADFASAIPDKAFHTIIFEACFMAGIEVVYQLKDKTDYILASSTELLSPGFTYIYPQELSKLVYNNDEQFMQAAFNYFDQQNGDMRSASFSLIKTDSLDVLAHYIKENCDFSKEISLSELQHFDRYFYRLFFDFEDYYIRLMPEDKKEYFLKLIDDIIVYKLATDTFMLGYNGFMINKHSGMTTYVMQTEFPTLNENYRYLDWCKTIDQ
ncbi:MAG: clostripain-related cysteine peptidase [Dysgonomonas sp.]